MSDIFKVGEFFLNYFLGQKNLISEKSWEISAEILNQLRRILILVVLTLGSLTLFCMGMSYLIERFLNNLDNGQTLLTPSIWFILGFLIVCVGIMMYATNKKNWLDVYRAGKKEAPATPPAPVNQIESMISLLILDFVKEREYKREKQKKSSTNEQA